MPPPALRDYQLRAIVELRAALQQRPILRLDTGAGKTSVAAEIIRRTTERGRRAVFLVHRRELVQQAVDRLAQFGVQAGQILAGERERRDRPVQVASIPTLVRRTHWPADLVIVDECAHARSVSWGAVLGRYAPPPGQPDAAIEQHAPAWVIGLTATPMRLDGKGLGDVFGCIVEPVTMRELIEQGHLIEPDVFAPPVDLKGLKVTRGDYSIPELAERMAKLVGSIPAHWFKHAAGLRTVVFAVNVDHSRRIVEAFREEGVRAEHLDGTTPKLERAAILARLKDGDLDLVSNCMVLSEGWDLPALQCAILARPTKSLALFRQMVGRVMRPPGPVTVLDHAGNHHEHGLVTDEIEWGLEDRAKGSGVGPPIRTCDECYAILPPRADACPQCGAPVVSPEPDIPQVHAAGELVKLRPAVRATKAEKHDAYRELVERASLRGYKLGWARMQFKQRFGVWPRSVRDIESELYRCSGHAWEEKDRGNGYIALRCSRCYAIGVSSPGGQARQLG